MNNYYIAIIRNYFDGQKNLMGATIAQDPESGSELSFGDIDDAIAVRDELEHAEYRTLNGEAGRPTYVVIDDDCYAWLASDDGSKYDWDDYDGDENDEDAQFVYMREQDERYVKSHCLHEIAYVVECYQSGEVDNFRRGWAVHAAPGHEYHARFDTLADARDDIAKLTADWEPGQIDDDLNFFGVRKVAEWWHGDDLRDRVIEVID